MLEERDKTLKSHSRYKTPRKPHHFIILCLLCFCLSCLEHVFHKKRQFSKLLRIHSLKLCYPGPQLVSVPVALLLLDRQGKVPILLHCHCHPQLTPLIGFCGFVCKTRKQINIKLIQLCMMMTLMTN